MKVKILILTCVFIVSCFENNNNIEHPDTEFAFIEEGTYTIGSPIDEFGRWPKGEEDIRDVYTHGFYISRTEITEEQYYAVVEPSMINEETKNLPVVNISWLDAIFYCNERSKNEGLEEVYTISPKRKKNSIFDVVMNENANGYRLPTIDEWEIACRAGTQTTFYTGKKITKKQANYDSQGITPVKSFPPNKFGLYDMLGNVEELCWRSEHFAMAKGGCWRSGMYDVRSSSVSFFGDNTVGAIGDYLGFRVVKNVEIETDETN